MKIDKHEAYILGEVALEGLLDRRDIKHVLISIKYEDPEIWDEILQESGDAVAKHLSER